MSDIHSVDVEDDQFAYRYDTQLLIDRRDDVINICEIKYSSEQYVITKEYERHLIDRTALFRYLTHTKKSLVNTFITTYGVKKNIHSTAIQKEVTMDDLFRNPDI